MFMLILDIFALTLGNLLLGPFLQHLIFFVTRESAH